MSPTRPSEPASGLTEEVIRCAERTLGAPSARILYRQETSFELPQSPNRPRRRGGLLRPLATLVKFAGKGAWKLLTRNVGQLEAEGFIEPAARRYIIDFGSYAQLFKDDQQWVGRSGRPLSTLDPSPYEPQHPQIWWPLDALRGTTEAALEGEENVRGTQCRRLAVRVDLARASSLAPHGLRPPLVERFEELLAYPLTVWLDGERARRVRFSEGGDPHSDRTVELWDFGVATVDLDWSRLPTFRSPDEAAQVGGERRPSLGERTIARVFSSVKGRSGSRHRFAPRGGGSS